MTQNNLYFVAGITYSCEGFLEIRPCQKSIYLCKTLALCEAKFKSCESKVHYKKVSIHIYIYVLLECPAAEVILTILNIQELCQAFRLGQTHKIPKTKF